MDKNLLFTIIAIIISLSLASGFFLYGYIKVNEIINYLYQLEKTYFPVSY